MKKVFKNPIMDRGADPWIYKHTDNQYYFMVTLQNRIDIWKSECITDISKGERKTVWTAPAVGAGSKNIWAPEIHYIQGKWYIYFAASDGTGDKGRRMYVLENESQDPLKGIWIEKGAINTEYAGLDGTVLEHEGELYFLYAGYGNFPEYGSAIYIAKMKNPWTLCGQETLLTKPEFDWEKQGGMAINEGPVILKRNKKIFLIYSASTTWSEDYSLGMLTASENSNILLADSWKKSLLPVFKKSVKNKVLAPGHNSFTTSPDGIEDWIVYHAITGEASGVKLDTTLRSTRIQKFSWNSDGTPDFGVPVSADEDILLPSGE